MVRAGAMIAFVAAAVLGACERSPKEGREPEPAANAAAIPENSEGATAVGKPLAIAAASPTLQWGPCPAGMPDGCGIAVLQGDPAKPNADIFLRVPGRSAIPPHRHSSAERMILVSGRLDVKYQGAAGATLNSGDYAYGPANLPHRAECRSAEPCTLFIAFEGPVDLLPFEGSLD